MACQESNVSPRDLPHGAVAFATGLVDRLLPRETDITCLTVNKHFDGAAVFQIGSDAGSSELVIACRHRYADRRRKRADDRLFDREFGKLRRVKLTESSRQKT